MTTKTNTAQDELKQAEQALEANGKKEETRGEKLEKLKAHVRELEEERDSLLLAAEDGNARAQSRVEQLKAAIREAQEDATDADKILKSTRLQTAELGVRVIDAQKAVARVRLDATIKRASELGAVLDKGADLIESAYPEFVSVAREASNLTAQLGISKPSDPRLLADQRLRSALSRAGVDLGGIVSRRSDATSLAQSVGVAYGADNGEAGRKAKEKAEAEQKMREDLINSPANLQHRRGYFILKRSEWERNLDKSPFNKHCHNQVLHWQSEIDALEQEMERRNIPLEAEAPAPPKAERIQSLKQADDGHDERRARKQREIEHMARVNAAANAGGRVPV
jgi:hypothetical protein